VFYIIIDIMDQQIINFLINTYNFEENVEYELTDEMKAAICQHCDIHVNYLGRYLTQSNLIKYYFKLQRTNLKVIKLYYITILKIIKPKCNHDIHDINNTCVLDKYTKELLSFI
jgi:hypothetical protein